MSSSGRELIVVTMASCGRRNQQQIAHELRGTYMSSYAPQVQLSRCCGGRKCRSRRDIRRRPSPSPPPRHSTTSTRAMAKPKRSQSEISSDPAPSASASSSKRSKKSRNEVVIIEEGSDDDEVLVVEPTAGSSRAVEEVVPELTAKQLRK